MSTWELDSRRVEWAPWSPGAFVALQGNGDVVVTRAPSGDHEFVRRMARAFVLFMHQPDPSTQRRIL